MLKNQHYIIHDPQEDTKSNSSKCLQNALLLSINNFLLLMPKFKTIIFLYHFHYWSP